MEPEGADAVYTESLVRLPGLGVWWAPEAERSPRTERVALGLRAGATVFWCGQSLPKYLPRYDQVWPRIAKGLSDCQFVFIGLPSASAADALFRTRLKIAFAEEGLDADRHCVILPRLAADDFRAAMGAADIFLDSLGWSGCNTTLESLVHDLPIVTWPGPFLRGRHSAAILTLMGVQETIAPDVDTYVEIAVRLAKDPAWRAEIRAKLAAAKGRLARDPAPVRALETFLEQAVGRA
jgi:predicted O-linked N-acetylglucosamine transferase (SPINDLY family)